MTPAVQPLPTESFILQGHCACKSTTYTLSIPTIQNRPLYPSHIASLKNNIPAPRVGTDGCSQCRHQTGALIQWMLKFPISWLEFSLSPLHMSPKNMPAAEVVQTKDKDLAELSTLRRYVSSAGNVQRLFCGNCGTNFVFHKEGEREGVGVGSEGGVVHLHLGTLEEGVLRRLERGGDLMGLRPSVDVVQDEELGWVNLMG